MMQMGRRMVAAPARPTRIIQFGEGNFLRGFLGPQVQQADDAGLFDGGIAIVQPRPGGHVDALERQDRLYTVVTEGLGVREHRIIDVVTATVDPYRAWDDFLALADDPHTGTIVSNTTEAGIAIDPRDTAATVPPRGFPAKLAHLMARRFARGLPGFLVLPCELIDDNAAQLKRCVLSCVADFGLGDDLAGWIESDNLFCSTLVDRIVSGFPAERAEALWVELGYRDDLIVVAEPALSWVVQGPPRVRDALPLAITLTDDLAPYRRRKVYLLNGPHTTMAQLGRLAGLCTVAEVMGDPVFRGFIQAQMRDELAPAVGLPAADLGRFCAEVVERFDNPWLHHSLDAIAANSVSKFAARLVPVIVACAQAGRPLPRRVVLALAGLLAIYGDRSVCDAGEKRDKVHPIDTDDVLETFRRADRSDFVPSVLAQTSLWGRDLTAVPGLVGLVDDDLALLASRGVRAAVEDLS